MKQCDCPECGELMAKAFYMGFTGRMCVNPGCATLMGVAADVAALWFVGPIVLYEGSYWKILWAFLKGDLAR